MNSAPTRKVRLVLRAGALVFGLSSVALLLVPGYFNELLGLANLAELEWSMRMTAITLIALSGNMYAHAARGTDQSVRIVGRVMMLSAFALGVLTLLQPASLTWFSIAYALVGFGFSTAYLWAFASSVRRDAP